MASRHRPNIGHGREIAGLQAAGPGVDSVESPQMDNFALDTFPALQAASNAHSDTEANAIRESNPSEMGSFNQAMALNNNIQNKVTPWAPFLSMVAGHHASMDPGPQALPDSPLSQSIALDPNSSFNTSGGPFGRFGVGTGGNIPTGDGMGGNVPTVPMAPEPETTDQFISRTRGPLNGLKRAGG